MSNTKKSVATTNSAKNNIKGVKPSAMVSEIKDIRENYGKNAIIIKDNLVFRCSTQVLEKGPKSLLELFLPNYGKMRKFIVKEDGVYELTTDVVQIGTNFAQYQLGDKTNIDPKNIDFNLENSWNFKKISDKVATK
jgi:hypothetical protein